MICKTPHFGGGLRPAQTRSIANEITYEQYAKASELLMGNHAIDVDLKKMVQHFWRTFLPESADPAVVEQTRGEILQWFSGEGTVGQYRKRFGVSKMVSKENAKLMLQSLAGFVRQAGYRGLVILFDEAEQAYSVMRTQCSCRTPRIARSPAIWSTRPLA